MSAAEPTRSSRDDSIVEVIDAMRAGIEAAPEIYRPGHFWDELIAKNLEMLEAEGITNLKRTVSNNYYNWLVYALRDPQLQRAATTWLRRPTLSPFTNGIGSATACARRGVRTRSRYNAALAGATSFS